MFIFSITQRELGFCNILFLADVTEEGESKPEFPDRLSPVQFFLPVYSVTQCLFIDQVH